MKELVKTVTLLCLFITFLLLKSCVKEENDLISQNCVDSCTTISGKITTNDGQQPLAGVEVTATWKYAIMEGGATLRKKARTHTDNYGNYILRFEVRDDEIEKGYFVFEVLTNKDYFTCYEEYPSFSEDIQKKDTAITRNLFVPYIAYLNIGAYGAEKMSTSDYFSVTVSPTINPNFCNQTVSWSKEDPTYIHKLKVPANQKLVIKTVIRIGQLYKRAFDTLYINKGQTVNFTALYNY